MKYTVVWHPDAQAALGEIWLRAYDRNTVTAASHRIDQLLRHSPRQSSRPVGDRLATLRAGPLQILFRISDADLLVEVVAVREIRPEMN